MELGKTFGFCLLPSKEYASSRRTAAVNYSFNDISSLRCSQAMVPAREHDEAVKKDSHL